MYNVQVQWQTKPDNIMIILTPEAYERLYGAVDDFVAEYGTSDDPIIKIWECMHEFEKTNKISER